MFLVSLRPLRALQSVAVVVLFAMICGAYFLAQIPPVSGNPPRLEGFKITVDPGHGGLDPGAVARDILEKDIVLDISLCLERILQSCGAEVILTRRDDRSLSPNQDLPLLDHRHDFEERKQIALQNGSDIFLSIHANSFPESYCEGPQMFYEEDSAPGRQLAIAIQEELNRLLPNSRRFPRTIDQYVLREMPLPAVTVEVGFMSNDAELARLLDPEYQERLVEAVVSGISLFLERGAR